MKDDTDTLATELMPTTDCESIGLSQNGGEAMYLARVDFPAY